MKTLALVLGILALALIAVRLLARLVVRLIPKPPLRIELVPIDPGAARYASQHALELREMGFEHLGVYGVPQIPGLVLTAFQHLQQGVVAIVYSHKIGVFFDLASLTTSDIGITVTTAPVGGNLDQPPGRRKVFDRKLSLRQAFERLLAERPPGPYKTLDAASFASVMADEYAREMDWRLQRGGVTEAEVRREAAAMNITSEATIQKTTRVLQEQWVAEGRRHSD